MASIQAVLGIAQLRKLERMNKTRRRNAEKLTRGLEKRPVLYSSPCPF